MLLMPPVDFRVHVHVLYMYAAYGLSIKPLLSLLLQYMYELTVHGVWLRLEAKK